MKDAHPKFGFQTNDQHCQLSLMHGNEFEFTASSPVPAMGTLRAQTKTVTHDALKTFYYTA